MRQIEARLEGLMMTRSVRAANAALAATVLTLSMAFAGSAGAVTMKATYTGTVAAGSYDQTGLFGQGTGSNVLDGLSATIEFVYNPSLPGILRFTNASQDRAYGGPVYVGTQNLILSSKITIGGNTQSIAGNYYGYVENKNILTYQYNSDDFGASYISARADSSSPYFPVGLETPVILTALDSDPYGIGQFRFRGNYLCDGGGNCAYDKYTYGFVSMTSLEIVALSEVPLPAALPLFATVLAGGGLVAWRRKKN